MAVIAPWDTLNYATGNTAKPEPFPVTGGRIVMFPADVIHAWLNVSPTRKYNCVLPLNVRGLAPSGSLATICVVPDVDMGKRSMFT